MLAFTTSSCSSLTLRTSAVVRCHSVHLQARVEICKRSWSNCGRGRWPWRTTAVVRLSPDSSQQFSLAAPDALGSASECSFFRVSFRREVPIQQVIGVQAVTSRGQRRVTPILPPVGASCLLDKGPNPRTGGQRPKDRRPPLLLTCTSTMTCSSYASTAVPYMVVASSPSTGWCPTLCRRTALPLRRVRHRQGFRRLLLRLLVVSTVTWPSYGDAPVTHVVLEVAPNLY